MNAPVNAGQGLPGSLCSTCGGFGFYFDRNCLAGRCAHRGRYTYKLVKERAERGTLWVEKRGKHTGRIMPCPRRACSECPAGRDEARALAARALQQYEALS